MTLKTSIAAILLSALPAMAQHSHSQHGDEGVTETGQAQFASIAQIVRVLRSDSSTEWGKVDIQALRDHLVDMDNVTTRSNVVVQADGRSVLFMVTGDATVAPSIQRMVTAHAPMLAKKTGWSVTPSLIADGATMKITTPESASRKQVIGLGFYGVMTIGAHHQDHHYMIALGKSPH